MSKWFRHSEIEVIAVAFLACGLEPYQPMSPTQNSDVTEVHRLLKKAINDKLLAGKGRNSEGVAWQHTLVSLDNLRRWAEVNCHGDIIGLCDRWAEAQKTKPWQGSAKHKRDPNTKRLVHEVAQTLLAEGAVLPGNGAHETLIEALLRRPEFGGMRRSTVHKYSTEAFQKWQRAAP